MASEKQANETLNFHQDNLFENENLAYLAVIPILDAEGNPTDKFTIEAGVYDIDMQQQPPGRRAAGPSNVLPTSLSVPGAPTKGRRAAQPEESIQIQFKKSEIIEPHSYSDKIRPASGGSSISNINDNQAGTLGCVLTRRGDSARYLLSNWHAMAGAEANIGDPIVQPGVMDGGTKQDVIANLSWAELSQTQDAAIAKVENNNLVTGGTRNFNFSGISLPFVGMQVKKCGRTTELTFGTILSTNATTRINYAHGSQILRNQLMLTLMSLPGDSGSAIVDNRTNQMVGLLFAGDSKSRTWANSVATVTPLGASLISGEWQVLQSAQILSRQAELKAEDS